MGGNGNSAIGARIGADIVAGLLEAGTSNVKSGMGSHKRVLVQTFNVIDFQASFE